MSYRRFTPTRFCRGVFAAIVLGLLCHLHALHAAAQTRNDLDQDLSLETVDALARDAADRALTRQGTDEPEERSEPAQNAPGFRVIRAFSQAQPQAAPTEAAPPQEPAVGTSSPVEILRQAKRVYIPAQGAPVAVPDSTSPEPPQATPDTQVTPYPADSSARTEPTPAATKRPGLVKRVIRAVPFIGSHLVNDKPTPPPTAAEMEQGRLDRVELDRDIVSQTTVSVPLLYPAPGDAITSDTSTSATSSTRIDDASGPGEAQTKVPAVESASTPLIIVDSAAAQAQMQTPAMATLTPAIAVRIQDPRVAATPGISSRPMATPLPLRSAAPAMPSTIIIPTPLPTATAASAHLMTPVSTTPAPTASVPTMAYRPAGTPSSRTSTTSKTVEQNDLAMPNPAVEENQLVRDEFAAAIREARLENYEHAAELLHTYAVSHPSSRLAPRALFLSLVFFPEAAWRESAEQELTERFSKTPYAREWTRRKTALQPKPSDLYSLMGQLEQELASDPAGPAALEKCCKLAALYVKQENFDRAYEVLAPYVETAKGHPEEPQVLDLLSECRIAQGQNAAAMNLLADLLERFPNYPGRSRVRLNMGLVNEAEGNYQRAAAEYRKLRQEAPDTPESRMAGERISDLQKLSE